MCLLKKSKMPRIALKDITVYKILRVYILERKKCYETIFRDCPVYLNDTQVGKFNDGETLFKSFKYSFIHSGYIHSYTSLEKAKDIVSFKDECIVKCIIPKGTLYWIGDKHDIASRKLKYKEVVVKEEFAQVYHKMV